MLIINADDLGKSERATDNIIECYRRDFITSASAMVFMKDSIRAAELSKATGLETGLHLNLTSIFSGTKLPDKMRELNQEIARYYGSGKWTRVLYNPMLKRKIEYLYKSQYDEFCTLYSKEPTKIDGHHHAHLFMDMIVGNIIARDSYVRRNFTFAPGDKDIFNRLYRRCVDSWLQHRYRCTDSFYSLEPNYDIHRLGKIMSLSRKSNVELAVHPDNDETYEFLIDTRYLEFISGISKGTYKMI